MAMVIRRTRHRLRDRDTGGIFIYRITCLAALSGLVLICMLRIRAPLQVTMIDVGQGDCHFIETAGKSMMIDCGSSDISDVARYRVIPYVMSKGYGRIDYALVTHTDEDHINGYIQMLSEPEEDTVKIGSLIMPDAYDTDGGYGELVRLASEKGVKVRRIHAGDRFDIGDVRIICLHPVESGVYADANEASVCLDVRYRGFRALYTGDVEGMGEQELMGRLEEGDLTGYTLLKCAHHGSAYSTSEELLRLVSPDITFISAGVNNKYDHPHKELIRRLYDVGSRVYVTKDLGAVPLITDGKKVRITGYLKEEG